MRIRLVQAAETDNTGIAGLTIEMLRSELEKDSSIVLTDTNPDVIHIIGGWDNSSRAIAKDACTRFIAFVHTPLSSLTPWQKPTTSSKKMTASATAVVASGQMEYELLNDDSINRLKLILNAVITATTSTNKMVEQYMTVYNEAVKKQDEALWAEVKGKVSLLKIEDPTIVTLCERILYAHYLYQRQSIPQSYIDDLSVLMTKSDYDEGKMGEVLKLIHLDLFTQQLEFVMKSKSTLTDGFMPIPCKEDKTSQQMLNIITDY